VERPETRFVWNGDSILGYQVLGDRGPDLLFLQGNWSNIELNWDHPLWSRFASGLARSRRLILMDERGTGVSERSSAHEVWPLETLMEDIPVVLDRVGSERTAILATNELGFLACMFAATFPERTLALILYEASANWLRTDETPWEWSAERYAEQEEWIKAWATPEATQAYVREKDPSVADDPAYVTWYRRVWMSSEAAGNVVMKARKLMDTDIHRILPSIHVPTLVLIRPDARTYDPSFNLSSRYLAEHIPGARVAELPGRDSSLWVGEPAAVLSAIDTFLSDVGRERSELERVLATVLFTDIVGSTEKAAELGDRAWRDLLERHHAGVRALLARFRGVEVDTTGDGFLATFDGPARAIRCAQAIVEEVRPLGVEVRTGLHTGEVETIDDKVGGLAVHIGARVGALAGASEVWVSSTVKDLVAGSGLAFEDAGEHELKGVPDRWHLYRVVR